MSATIAGVESHLKQKKKLVQEVSLVIDDEFPLNRKNFIHRIKVSRRFGRKAVAINFVTLHEVRIDREVKEEEYKLTQFLVINSIIKEY